MNWKIVSTYYSSMSLNSAHQKPHSRPRFPPHACKSFTHTPARVSPTRLQEFHPHACESFTRTPAR
eukprot:6967842-Pyramimonas_sp.AAC.1